MKLLNMMRPAGSAVYSDALTLDALWERAEALGHISVNDWFTDKHKVTISFKLRSGSKIEAVGNNPDIRQAFAEAIDEAMRLGARP